MSSRFPAEVIQIILLNLEKYDLLNSRLVSKVWNEESLKILQKSKYRQKLRSSEIGKYVDFVKSLPNPQIVLRFQLVLNNLCISPLPNDNLTIVSEQINKLVEIFGQSCILNLRVNIAFAGAGQVQIQNLIHIFHILAQLSSGLETLNINTSSEMDVASMQNALAEGFVLQKLKKFSLSAFINAHRSIPVWFKLIEKCPNLEQLEISTEFAHLGHNVELGNNFRLPLEQIKSLKLINFTYEPILRIIRQYPPQLYILSHLELSVELSGENIPGAHVKEILAAFSESLQNIRLVFSRPSFSIPLSLPFPILSRLKHLGILFETPKPIKLEIDDTLFPELESIELSPCVQFHQENFTLPRINSLTLRLSENIMMWEFVCTTPRPLLKLKPYQEHFEKLLKTFPSLSRICFKNEMKNMNEGEGSIKYVLNGIIRSAGVEKITEIILKDCELNYLGDILHRVQNPPVVTFDNFIGNRLGISLIRKSFKLFTGSLDSELFQKEELGPDGQQRMTIQGVKFINRLNNVQKLLVLHSRTQDNSQLLENNISEQENIHVDNMVKNLPNLKEMEISAYYFGCDSGRRIKLIQDTQAKFPDLVLHVV